MSASTAGLALSDSPDIIDTGQLVDRARGGDREAFEEVYRRYYPRVTRRVSFLVGPQGPVADLVQETFVKAYRGLGSFNGERPFGHWVMRIATNTARSHHRRRGRRLWRLWDRAEDAERVPSPVSTVDTSYPDLQAVHRALERLSANLREAVVLHELEGLSLAEIAALLEISINTAASRVRRGRKRLKRALEGMGFSPGAEPAVALLEGGRP